MERSFFEILKIEYQDIFEIEEVKTFLRVSHNQDDKLIENLIQASMEAAENFIGICLNKKHIKYVSTSNFRKEIKLKYSPIRVINKVFYKYNNQEIEIVDYEFVKDIGVLYLKSPTDTKHQLNIFYEVGLDKTLIPFALKQGILEHIAYIYDGAESNDFLSVRIKNFYFPYRGLKL